MKKTSRVTLVTVAALALVSGGAATAYAAHYQDRALPGSEVAGLEVAGLTRAEVAKAMKDRAESVKITVTTPSGTRNASLAQVGQDVDVDATVDRVFEANSDLTNFARALVTAHPVEVVTKSDTAAQEAFVADLVKADGAPATNATVQLPEGTTTFTVTPAVAGKTLDPASLDAVKASGRTLTSTSVTAKFVESQPAVSTADAQAVADKANAIVGAPVTITEGSKEFTASPEAKASWVQIAPAADGKLAAPTLDQAKVAEWVNEKAGSLKVETRNGTRNVSSTGAVLKVTTEARDGVEVTDAAQVAEALTTSLTSATAYAGKFTTQVTQATWTERKVAAGAENLAYPAAEGEKWIDVNLSNHTMTAYEGGRAVIGPVSMVDGASATPTATGTYKVYLKYAKQTMRGENADGTNYEAPDVPWVTYWHRGYALHGAPWRDSFGYTGSHGCVNLPVDVAKRVYDFAPIGTTVVSHR